MVNILSSSFIFPKNSSQFLFILYHKMTAFITAKSNTYAFFVYSGDAYYLSGKSLTGHLLVPYYLNDAKRLNLTFFVVLLTINWLLQLQKE